jgi:hypothetical protein
MKAAVYYENGGPDVLKYEDAPDPTCSPGGGIIREEAIAIEGGDVLNRFGGYRSKDRTSDLDAMAPELAKIRPVPLYVTNRSLLDGAVAEAWTAAPIDVVGLSRGARSWSVCAKPAPSRGGYRMVRPCL